MPYLQALGVRYVMVRTDEAKAQAEAQPELELLATSGPWEIFQVADADIVVPLDVQPVVVEPRSGDQRERNLELGTSWFQHRDEWAAVPANDGPADWQRIEVAADESRLVPDPNRAADDPDVRGKQVDIVVPQTPIDPVALPAVEVSDVEMGQQDVSFHVDEVGVPVLVKVSYFPNWAVDGADGPYRVAPNFMVVVPTQQDVRLHYDRSHSDLFFYLLTLGGIVLLIGFRIRGDVDLDAPLFAGRRRRGSTAADEPARRARHRPAAVGSDPPSMTEPGGRRRSTGPSRTALPVRTRMTDPLPPRCRRMTIGRRPTTARAGRPTAH